MDGDLEAGNVLPVTVAKKQYNEKWYDRFKKKEAPWSDFWGISRPER